MNDLSVSNSSKTSCTCRQRPMLLGERFRQTCAEFLNIGRSDFVDRLFGELTHFSYVVELGNKSTFERKNS